MHAVRTTIQAEDGTTYQITAETMLKACDRAQKYLQEAVHWSAERDAHIAGGAKTGSTTRHDQWLKRNQVPDDVWFPLETSFTPDDQAIVMAILQCWTDGTLESFGQVYAKLEEDMDLDPTYLFFGAPIYQLSTRDQRFLHDLGAKFASRRLSVTKARRQDRAII